MVALVRSRLGTLASLPTAVEGDRLSSDVVLARAQPLGLLAKPRPRVVVQAERGRSHGHFGGPYPRPRLCAFRRPTLHLTVDTRTSEPVFVSDGGCEYVSKGDELYWLTEVAQDLWVLTLEDGSHMFVRPYVFEKGRSSPVDNGPEGARGSRLDLSTGRSPGPDGPAAARTGNGEKVEPGNGVERRLQSITGLSSLPREIVSGTAIAAPSIDVEAYATGRRPDVEDDPCGGDQPAGIVTM